MTTPQQKTAPSDPSSETEQPSEIRLETSKYKIKQFEIDGGRIKSDLLTVLPVDQAKILGGVPNPSLNQEHLLSWIKKKTLDFHPLPMAIRWFKVSGNSISAVMESPPRMQAIHFYPAPKHTSGSQKALKIQVPVPWVQMGVNVTINYNTKGEMTPSRLRVTFVALTDKPLGPSPSKNKQLYAPLLPNTFIHDYSTNWKAGSVCYEASIPASVADKLSLSGIFSYMVNDYWNSTFNYNLPSETRYYSKFLEACGGKARPEDIPKDSPWYKFRDNVSSRTSDIQTQVLYRWSMLSVEDIMDLEKYGFPSIGTEANLYDNVHKTHSRFEDFRPFEVYDATKVPVKTLPLIATKDGLGKPDAASIKAYTPSAQALHAMNKVLREMYSLGPGKDTNKYSAKGMITTPQAANDAKKTLTISYDQQAGMGGGKVDATIKIDPVKVSEAANLWLSHFNSGDKALPPGLRFWDPIAQFVVFERPPGTRRIYWDKNYKEGAAGKALDKKKHYDIWLPWTQYWVVYNTKRAITHLYVTTASSSLSKPTTQVGILPLSNIYTDARICLPNSVSEYPDLTSLILASYNMMWSSNYNMDLSDAIVTFVNSLHLLRDDMKKDYPEDYKKLVTLVGHEHGYTLVQKFLKIMTECNPENILKLWPRVYPIVNRGEIHPSHEGMCPSHMALLSKCDCKITKKYKPFTAQDMAEYVRINSSYNWLNNQIGMSDAAKPEPIAGIFLKYANTYASKMLH